MHAPACNTSNDVAGVNDKSTVTVDAAVFIPDIGSSTATNIYDLNTPRKRYIILFVAAVAAILLPFTDTIYLPALQVKGLCHDSSSVPTSHYQLCLPKTPCKVCITVTFSPEAGRASMQELYPICSVVPAKLCKQSHITALELFCQPLQPVAPGMQQPYPQVFNTSGST